MTFDCFSDSFDLMQALGGYNSKKKLTYVFRIY